MQGRIEAQRARLRGGGRLKCLGRDGAAGDPAAVAQEIVRFVARSDVDEEIVRMRGHLEHWRQLSEGPEACGRKLDFLVQEMNREINTVGSKVDSAKATEIVIAAKAELDRRGIRQDGPIQDIPGMVRLLTFYDPDDNALMFYQDLSQAHEQGV